MRAADIVVTDMDGVAIVPREHAEEVLKKPQQLDDTEHSTLPFIETYKSIREAVVRCCSAVAAPEKADSLCRTHVPGPPHSGSSQRSCSVRHRMLYCRGTTDYPVSQALRATRA